MKAKLFAALMALCLGLAILPAAAQAEDGTTEQTEPAASQTIYVDAEKGDDANPGTTEAEPVATLDKAVSLVSAGGGTENHC
ncbi:MAG: hypothetical protein Q4C56_01405 [Peptococcaceae bacterium]|nr:hypothetical protein [Peptococcaceae bacterium]